MLLVIRRFMCQQSNGYFQLVENYHAISSMTWDFPDNIYSVHSKVTMSGIVVINISLEGDNEVSEIYKLHRQTRWVDLEAMVRGNVFWGSFTKTTLNSLILVYLIKCNSISEICFWKLFDCHKRACV